MKDKNSQKPQPEKCILSPWSAAQRFKGAHVVVYPLTWDEIGNCHTDRLVHDLRISPDNPLVGLAHGNVVFTVEGYEKNTHSLARVPEFVRFMRKVEESRPCWLYFLSPESGWLTFILGVCGCVGDLEFDKDGNIVGLEVERDLSAAFCLRQLKDYQMLCRYGDVDEKTAIGYFCILLEQFLPECKKMLMAGFN